MHVCVRVRTRVYVCVNKKEPYLHLNLVDKFIYLDSNISSTECDVNVGQAKARNATEKLSIICKSDLSDKIKRDFFQDMIMLVLLFGCTT